MRVPFQQPARYNSFEGKFNILLYETMFINLFLKHTLLKIQCKIEKFIQEKQEVTNHHKLLHNILGFSVFQKYSVYSGAWL